MSTKAGWIAPIVLGEVLKKRNGQELFCVVKTGDGQRWSYLIELEREKEPQHRNAQPFQLTTEELLSRLLPDCAADFSLERVSQFVFLDESQPTQPTNYFFRAPGKVFKCRKDPSTCKGWQLITELLTFDLPDLPDGSRPPPSLHGDQFEELLHKSTRDKRIKRCKGNRKSPSAKLLRTTLRRFLQGGMTPSAVMDHYARCGGRGKPRNYTRRPGRRSKAHELNGSTLTFFVRSLLWLAADDYLTYEYAEGKRQQKTMKQSVDFVNAEFGNLVEFRGDDDARIVRDTRLKITVRMLQNLICTQVPYELRRRHKVGKKHFDLHERALKGVIVQSRGPAERYHIDASVADVYLVGTYMRTKVVGRPTIYFVVDDYSRMIVGVHASLDPPSWRGAMLALVNAISPKVPFCHGLGISVEEKEWPSQELCAELFGDNAELASTLKAQPLTREYRVEVLNPPSYRPDLRSVMEVRFRILPKLWTPLVPGVVEKNSFERGRAKPALGSALCREEFLKVVVKATLVYNKTPIRGYPTPPEMIAREWAPTPLNLWNYGHERNGCGRHVDVAKFRSSVIARDTAVIRGKGIEFRRLTYDCPLSLEERQVLFRAEAKSTGVTVGYDATHVSNIYLYGLGEPVVCPLAEGTSNWVHGLSFAEVELYAAWDALNGRLEMHNQAASRAEQRVFTEDISRNAVKERNKELKERGLKHVDISHIEESRTEERAVTGSASLKVAETGPRGSNAVRVRGGALHDFVQAYGQRGDPDMLRSRQSQSKNLPDGDQQRLDSFRSSANAEEAHYQSLLDRLE